ncbi:MAG: flagellar motor protein MotB [Burkholderiaceae bacterium]|nr:flagellar motor protein MotB [Burkholderiaceae bacterium]
MSSEKAKSTIVIKKIKKGGHAHHGGAWKIAYADFVTAMMAFFLLMWLLGSTTKGDLKGISDYFQSPLQVAMMGGTGSGDATSLIQGGGPSLTQQTGQVKNGDVESDKRRRAQERAERAKRERAQMEALKAKLEGALQLNPKLSEMRHQIRIEITPDGLRIQIVDDFNRPMFLLGGAQVQPYMRDLLQEIGKVLNEVDNKVALSGHTDAAPYVGGERGYSNWELSADRANASRRELIAGGMAGDKVVRVVGLADSSLSNKDNPRDPLNRRISIIVMNKIAEEKMNQAGGEIEAGSADDVERNLQTEAAAPDVATSQVATTTSSTAPAAASPGTVAASIATPTAPVAR